ncbi:lipopolysaccharide biosynthesis protein [Aliarcobacter cryaerophilus]|uniref:lipopolysaccharide biosynthesis protein n=1 Tax=Aliarcobacter cryaerophilus TaxID=28198 RepID=UPI003DA47F76
MKKIVILEVTFFRVLTIILQLVFLKIYSNYLSIYELGLYYLFMTLSYSFNAIFLVPLDYFQQSKLYLLKNEKKSISSFLPINIFVFKVSVILLVFIEIIIYIIDSSFLLVGIILVLFALVSYANNLLRGFLNNFEYRRNAIYTLLVESTLKILLFWVAIQFFSASSTLLFFTTTISMIIICLALILILIKKEEFKYTNRNCFKVIDIYHFSYPISFGAVINWIQLQGYRILLAPMGHIETIGLYATVANIGQTGMNAASTVYAQLFVPNIYKTNGEYTKKYIGFAILVILFVLFVGMIFSETLVVLLTSNKFAEYSYLIGYGILAESCNLIIGGLSIYLTIHNLTKKTIIASWIGLLSFVSVFFILYLIDFLSVWTIGLPIVLSQLFVAIYLYYIVFFIYNIKDKSHE